MTTVGSGSYQDHGMFAAADRRAAKALNVRFEEMLYHSLLLEPGIVIPDIFFFNSPGISAHVLGDSPGPQTFLELGLKEGYVIPALRQDVTNFRDVLKYLRKQDIRGMLPDRDTERIAYRLQANQREGLSDMIWPSAMSSSYEDLLVNALQDPMNPPGFGQSVGVSDSYWSITERFRRDAINEARELEYARNAGLSNAYGVRRAEIIEAVGRRLNVLSSGEKVIDSDEVLQRYEARLGSRESEEYKATCAFFEWLDELYHLNQSNRMSVRGGTTTQEPHTLAILQAARGQISPVTPIVPSETFSIDIAIPTIGILKRIDPKTLHELRQLYGLPWNTAALDYTLAPSVITRKVAEEKLDKFAQALRKCATDQVKTSDVRTVNATVAALGRLGQPALIAAGAWIVAVENQLPYDVVTVSAVTSGFMGYKYFRELREKRKFASTSNLTVVRSRQNFVLPGD